MSGMYGPVDEAEGIATIQAELDQVVTLLDAGNFYGAAINSPIRVFAKARPKRTFND